MRRRNTELHTRVNGDLALEFTETKLTSYAGLELLDRYLRRIRFNELVRTAFDKVHLGGDFGVLAMVRVLIGLLVLGGRRLEHLKYLASDPLLQRFARVRVWPTARTASRWLKRFTMQSVEHLAALNAAVIAQILPRLELRSLTIDVDGTVVSTGLQVERAERGYNPHHRKVPSYYPIMAHLAETTHVLRVRNRSGNVHDGKASLGFLRELWRQLADFALPSRQLRVRMDGAFFREDVLRWLAWRELGYALKVPFYRWLDLQQFIRNARTWTRVTAEVSGFRVPAVATPWGKTLPVAIYRRKVAHQSAKNFQLDLFDPDDGSYEYSAITSNLDYTLANLWHFMAGRGAHEKTIAQLKSGLAFHTVPTLAYAANSAWQQLVALAHNLLTNFQIDTGAERRRRSRKHTALPRLSTVQTLRFTLFHRAAALVRPGGRTMLRLTSNPATERLFTRIEHALPYAA
ncbi:MAG: IS1380 family transposase [Candidatus Acidiferrales bacterium]